MSWLDALSSPIAGATYAATAVYLGAVALEKGMRKEALQDIAGFINRTSIVPDAQIVAEFVYREFRLIFGERHFSLRCAWRSVIASCIVVCGLFILMNIVDRGEDRQFISFAANINTRRILAIFATIISFSFIPDYFSLLKGRALLKRMAMRPTIRKMLTISVVDLVASMFIYFGFLICTTLIMVLITINDSSTQTNDYSIQEVFATLFLSNSSSMEDHKTTVDFISLIIAVTAVGTVVTSLWTALTMLSCVMIKAISSVNILLRVMRWMFDVEAHPVGVLGRAAAGLVWAGSLVLASV
jgi:hypothetical protein